MVYSKKVMLEYASQEFHVTEEGYEQIKDLIKFYQVCKTCKNRIDEGERLLVGRNLCLSCLLHGQSSLTFMGPLYADSDGDMTYIFTDSETVVYTSTANTSDQARKDIFASITKAGFPLLEYFVPFKGDKDNPVKLSRYNWTIYGSLKNNSVIVLEYTDRYPDIKAVFLSYKGGEVVELNKRNLAFKQMFERAKAVIERTKHKRWEDDYYYRPDGTEISRISDDDLYPIIAQFESAVWDVQRAFMPAYTQPELIAATPQPLVTPVEDNGDPNLREDSSIEDKEEPDQDAQVEQETLSLADSVPEEIAPVLLENGEMEQPTPQVVEIQQSEEDVVETQDAETSIQEDQPEEAVASETDVTSKTKRGKRGSLSIVPKE